MLRHMAAFHAKNPSLLFVVRLAQGLVHLGKGTLTLTPFHADRQLMSVAAMAGLLVPLFAALDMRTRKGVYNVITLCYYE
jgi:26S proteasome regulatory subunit N1